MSCINLELCPGSCGGVGCYLDTLDFRHELSDYLWSYGSVHVVCVCVGECVCVCVCVHVRTLNGPVGQDLAP